MTEFLTSEISLQQRAQQELAKICWGENVLTESIDNHELSVYLKIKKLITHKDEILKKLPEILITIPKPFSGDIPERFTDQVINAVICLQEGYKEAIFWEKHYSFYLPFTILNPAVAGEYQAGNFIDSTGHFNDFLWVNKFVADENQVVHNRFQLACLYCLEEMILSMWHFMKTSGQLPCKGNLRQIKLKYGDLVGLWAYQLDNKIDMLIEEESYYLVGISICNLEKAINQKYEYAARYFWLRCTDIEKAIFLEDFDFDILFKAAINKCTGLVYFIYSQFNLERKKDFIYWSVEHDTGMIIWSCLLAPRFQEGIFKEIVTFPFRIPLTCCVVYCYVLAIKMQSPRNPIHEKIFKLLWNHLSLEQKTDVSGMALFIDILVRKEAFRILEIFFQYIPNRRKNGMLFENRGYASEMYGFSRDHRYDTLLHFVLLFLIDHNPSTQKLNTEASTVLDYFFYRYFYYLHRNSKFEIDHTWNLLQILQANLDFVNDLFQQVGIRYAIKEITEFVLSRLHDVSMPSIFSSFPMLKGIEINREECEMCYQTDIRSAESKEENA